MAKEVTPSFLSVWVCYSQMCSGRPSRWQSMFVRTSLFTVSSQGHESPCAEIPTEIFSLAKKMPPFPSLSASWKCRGKLASGRELECYLWALLAGVYEYRQWDSCHINYSLFCSLYTSQGSKEQLAPAAASNGFTRRDLIPKLVCYLSPKTHFSPPWLSTWQEYKLYCSGLMAEIDYIF